LSNASLHFGEALAGKTAGGIGFALIFWFFWIKPKELKKRNKAFS